MDISGYIKLGLLQTRPITKSSHTNSAHTKLGPYLQKSRYENPQKLTHLSPRSHPRYLVGKKTAQKDTIIDITSDSQMNTNIKGSFFTLTVRLWNGLPANVIAAPTMEK